MTDFFEEIMHSKEDGRNFALAVIVETEGSVPRHAGSKMLVYSDGSFSGTVGGGVTEQQVKADAVESLKIGQPMLKHYKVIHADNDDKSMLPEGSVSVYIEPFAGRTPLVICGAGHVGGKLISLAQMIGFSVSVIDIRDPQTLQERIKGADHFISTPDFIEGLEQIPDREGTYYLVCSFSHAHDEKILKAVLQRKFAYVGMLGSKEKIAAIYSHLREAGITDEQLKRVHAPVGLMLGGETPEEIALAIAAEMLQVRTGKKTF